jgi:hypothetical protein
MNLLQFGGQLTDTVYLGHDNWLRLKLQDDAALSGIADLTAISVMRLAVGESLISSDNTVGDPILWNQSGYEAGEVRLQLGSLDLTAGRYPRCYLTVYDSANPNGVVWGALQLFVLDEVEAGTEAAARESVDCLGDYASLLSRVVALEAFIANFYSDGQYHFNYADLPQYTTTIEALAGGLVDGDLYVKLSGDVGYLCAVYSE